MDFASMGQTLAKNDGVQMHLTGPDGTTPLYAVKVKDGWEVTTDPDAKGAEPCILTVVGQDSRIYRRRRHEMVDALRDRARQMKSAQVEQEAMKMVSAGVTGWSNIPWEGNLLEFSNENLLKFLDSYRPAFDQVNEFIADRTNFLRIG